MDTQWENQKALKSFVAGLPYGTTLFVVWYRPWYVTEDKGSARSAIAAIFAEQGDALDYLAHMTKEFDENYPLTRSTAESPSFYMTMEKGPDEPPQSD